MDVPIPQEVIRVVESAPSPAPNTGGGQPLVGVERLLGTHTIVIPTCNQDKNQHSYSENLRLQNSWDGIASWRRLFHKMPFNPWIAARAAAGSLTWMT
jgi:hypothetical protein